MLLAIDSGNTNIVFAIFSENGEVRGEWRSGTESNRTADEFGIWLTQLLTHHGVKKEDITDAIIATVVPDNLIHLKNLCFSKTILIREKIENITQSTCFCFKEFSISTFFTSH